MPRGASRLAWPQAHLPASGIPGWSNGSGREPRWLCPATVCSACAIFWWPCSPIGRAGTGWTRERVPQILNQNAFKNSPSESLSSGYYLAPPVQLKLDNVSDAPESLFIPFRRTKCALSSKFFCCDSVSSWDQAACPVKDRSCCTGDVYASEFPLHRRAKRTWASMNEP